MQRIIGLFICLLFLTQSVYAEPLIVDEFAEQTLSVEQSIENYDKSKTIVEDDFAKKFVDKYIKSNKVLSLEVKQDNIIDDIANKIDTKKVKQVKSKTRYNFAIAPIPVKLRIAENITTKKQNVKEGDLILFKTISPIKLGKIFLPENTEVVGRVETVSPNDLLGTPADLIVDNFFVKNNEKINLYGSIKKRGADRSWWLYPIYQAGNIAFWAAGYPLILVRGGHAKLTTKETFTVYYEIQ